MIKARTTEAYQNFLIKYIKTLNLPIDPTNLLQSPIIVNKAISLFENASIYYVLMGKSHIKYFNNYHILDNAFIVKLNFIFRWILITKFEGHIGFKQFIAFLRKKIFKHLNKGSAN